MRTRCSLVTSLVQFVQKVTNLKQKANRPRSSDTYVAKPIRELYSLRFSNVSIFILYYIGGTFHYFYWEYLHFLGETLL